MIRSSRIVEPWVGASLHDCNSNALFHQNKHSTEAVRQDHSRKGITDQIMFRISRIE